MAKLESYEELRDYALRALGSPVINIEIEETQMQDRVDDAIQKFIEKHFDGTEEVWEAVDITAKDVANGYIKVPEKYIAIVQLIDMSVISRGQDPLTNIEYQFYLNNYDDIFKPLSLSYYHVTKSYLGMIKDMFNPTRTFTYNKATNRLKIYDTLVEGEKIVLNGYAAIDPDVSIDLYNDEWIKKYVIALFKRQWGTNVKKYSGIQLPGGIEMNGQQIFDEANEDIKDLDERFSLEYELPVDFYWG